jgi:hypothetical protein
MIAVAILLAFLGAMLIFLVTLHRDDGRSAVTTASGYLVGIAALFTALIVKS